MIEDTVGLIIWSAVELAVTLICVGIAAATPLYRAVVEGSHPGSSNLKYDQHKDTTHSPQLRMQSLAKDSRFAPPGHTESYIVHGDRSDEECLVNQHGILVKQDVHVTSV